MGEEGLELGLSLWKGWGGGRGFVVVDARTFGVAEIILADVLLVFGRA